MGFDPIDRLSVPELEALERAEQRWPEFHQQCHLEGVAVSEARTPRDLLAALDPMDTDPLVDDSPRDRYWDAAEERMNGVG